MVTPGASTAGVKLIGVVHVFHIDADVADHRADALDGAATDRVHVDIGGGLIDLFLFVIEPRPVLEFWRYHLFVLNGPLIRGRRVPHPVQVDVVFAGDWQSVVF